MRSIVIPVTFTEFVRQYCQQTGTTLTIFVTTKLHFKSMKQFYEWDAAGNKPVPSQVVKDMVKGIIWELPENIEEEYAKTGLLPLELTNTKDKLAFWREHNNIDLGKLCDTYHIKRGRISTQTTGGVRLERHEIDALIKVSNGFLEEDDFVCMTEKYKPVPPPNWGSKKRPIRKGD